MKVINRRPRDNDNIWENVKNNNHKISYLSSYLNMSHLWCLEDKLLASLVISKFFLEFF